MPKHNHNWTRGGNLLWSWARAIGLDLRYAENRTALRLRIDPNLSRNGPLNWADGFSKPCPKYRILLEDLAGIPYDSWEEPGVPTRQIRSRKAPAEPIKRGPVKQPNRGSRRTPLPEPSALEILEAMASNRRVFKGGSQTNLDLGDKLQATDELEVSVTIPGSTNRPAQSRAYTPMSESDWLDWMGMQKEADDAAYGRPVASSRIRSTWDIYSLIEQLELLKKWNVAS